MTAIRIQGLMFSVAALLLSGYHMSFGMPDGVCTLFVSACSIVLLGVPHGALDTLYAARVFGFRQGLDWISFSAAYLMPVLATMALWQYWPGFFLVLFLAVSIMHFSGDPEHPCPVWVRYLYGGAPVVLPALLHGSEVARLFSYLAPSGVASGLQAVLGYLAWPWLAALSAGVLLLWRNQRQGAMEIAAVTTLCAVAPPMLSFTLFFCGMHSARHILRSLGEDHVAGASDPRTQKLRQAIVTGLPPMIAALAILFLVYANAANLAMEPRLIQTVFVGLAALTFPHVVLVDWFYHRGMNRHSHG